MKRGIIIIAITMTTSVASAGAITQPDAVNRFHNYIRGRCGNLLYKCQGLVVFGCLRVGSQPGEAQWTCTGDVYERIRIFVRKDNVRKYIPTNRTCEVIASYAPNGKRVFGDKSCGGLS